MHDDDDVDGGRVALRYPDVKGEADKTLVSDFIAVGPYEGNGKPPSDIRPLNKRELLTVDSTDTTLAGAMNTFRPRIKASVKNHLGGATSNIEVDIPISGGVDTGFSPEQVAKHIPQLNELLAIKDALERLRELSRTDPTVEETLNELRNAKDQVQALLDWAERTGAPVSGVTLSQLLQTRQGDK